MKDNVQRIRRQVQTLRKYLQKTLLSKMCKEPLTCNNKKTNNLIKKWAPNLNRYLTKEDIPLHTYANGQNPGHWQHQVLTNMWSRGTLIHCWWKCKTVQPLWMRVWWFLTKLNILLPYDPAVTLFGTYPKEMKNYVHRKTCTVMFLAALFITAKTWEQPNCPSKVNR